MTDILDQSWKPSPDAFANAVGDETVLLHLKRSAYYGIDALGSRIWQGLSAEGDLKRLCREIAADYEVPVEQVEDDTRKFLEELKANDIIVAR